ncbi:YCF48-related protein [Bacteroidota bacterium]
MHRLLRLSFLLVLFGLLAFNVASAEDKPTVFVSGRVAPDNVRVFVKDSVYIVSRDYIIGGTLIIEPGTTVLFYANSRMIDSVGGRIIADGYAGAGYIANPVIPEANNTESTSDEVLYPDYPFGKNNPFDFQDYADLNYFLYNTAYLINDNMNERVIDMTTPRDATVNSAKYHHIFHVVLDRSIDPVTLREKRELMNLEEPTDVVWDATDNLFYLDDGAGNPDKDFVVISFEQALMFITARMGRDPEDDIDLRRFPWTRVESNEGQTPAVNIGTGDAEEDMIIFKGQPENNFSREWGHILVLPGARAAYFRNCTFEQFKKDTTVDRTPVYSDMMSDANWAYINNRLRLLTNGTGGVLTTLSSRTWLIDCKFTDNMARHKGGALAILQVPNFATPNNFPIDENAGDMFDIHQYGFGRYPINKNPNITNKDGSLSSINIFKAKESIFIPGDPALDGDGYPVPAAEGDPFVWISTIPAIDLIDEANPEPTFDFAGDPSMADYYRQAFDDARVAVYLGRIRNLVFENNKVQLANVGTEVIPGTPPQMILKDHTDLEGQYAIPADYPREYGNIAYGGAIYIAGDETDLIRQIEVGFGINNIINLNDGTSLTFTKDDAFECTDNKARNFQNQLQSAGITGSKGARGGAIYAGSNTSLIVAGEFVSNVAEAPWLQNEITPANNGFYAMGGAIFQEKTRARLQVRGGPARDQDLNENPTQFIDNQAGAGGAIYIDENLNHNNNFMSPIIGGSDATVSTRDYGFNIQFKDNIALSFGGAVFSKRNFTINGAGGIEPLSESLIGYGGKFPVLFENNSAGFVGGAIDVRLPISSDLVEKDRALEMTRAIFLDNKVGYSVYDSADLKRDIRGGGAVYTINGSISVVRGVEFKGNMVKNGNGGAIAMINPQSNTKRYFVSDIDVINYNNGMANSLTSLDEVFTTSSVLAGNAANKYPPDSRMLTRFLDNTIEWDEDFLELESGSGTTQIGAGSIGTSENLNDAHFLDQQTGFVVGGNGMIIKLISGGAEWQLKNGNTSKNLSKVVFSSQNVGFIIGKNSLIMKTTDGGETWIKKHDDDPVTDRMLFDIVFPSSLLGYAVGEDGLMLKTEDAGETWTVVDAETLSDIYAVDFTSIDGYIVGEWGLIKRTNDNGATWIKQSSNTLQDLTDIYFSSSTTGYVIGTNGTILRTVNRGTDWNVMNANTEANLNSIVFADQNTAYIAADEGKIVKTSDAGYQWTEINTGLTTHSLNDVFFLTRTFGYAVGDLGTIIKTTNAGIDWEAVEQANQSEIDAKRFHANGETTIPENGIGLGGAIYILDVATIDRADTREDTVQFNRVRIQDNASYTGAAIYSDNYDLKLIFNRSLITGNEALSEIGAEQNLIGGPYLIEESISHTFNRASSDLAGAIIYGEIQGPLPSSISNWAANSIYDNNARFLIRLPDAPNSKGVLAGTTGVGMGGTDTLRANYWGRTEANVTMEVENLHIISNAKMETFFVDSDSTKRLDFIFWQSLADRSRLESEYGNLLFQGPFESIKNYDYQAIPLRNINDENTPDYATSIPENLLQSGRVYDLYDKGTDIKVADYTKRRMSPIEDFAVGIPPMIDRFMPEDTTLPSYTKYVKRYSRDPFFADSVDEGFNWVYPELHELQGEFMHAEDGSLYQPIGYPLFLETIAKYESGLADRYNLDPRTLNETVFFVINETTGDFIRVNLKQMNTTSPFFRARVELVPDSSDRNPNPYIRRTFEGLLNLGTDAPGGDPKLLKALRHNPYNEDRATLVGRKYENDNTYFGGTMSNRIEDLFINRPHWPETNKAYGTEYATFFAGERYRSLPVNVDDVVRIVSRTVLWREGVNKALEDGILINITSSTEPPVYTGDVEETMNKVITKEELSQYPWGYVEGRVDEIEITEFRNTIFITEDRMYPVPQMMYSNPASARLLHTTVRFNEYVQRYGNAQIQSTVMYAPNGASNAVGRDRIMNVTAKDTNKYYDPRSLYVPDEYSNLFFDFVVDPNSGLDRWIFKEHIPAGKTIDETKWGFSNPTPDDVSGFMVMRGRPTNPFVVPGGETLTVRVHNFPPHYRTIDSLEALPEDQRPAQDTIDKFMEIFSSYLHAPIYDDVNARYLQQDTIDLGREYLREYECKIYVVDSVPIFLDPDAVDEDTDDAIWPKDVFVETNIDGDEYIMGTYEPSFYPCRSRRDGRLLGNLTNKLRFQADFNTNDELEDKWAEDDWDFRFGRSAYGFKSTAIRYNDNSGNGADTTVIDPYVIDTTEYDGQTVLVQQRPIWMDTQFLHYYDNDVDVDEFASDFTINGQLNVRIDSAFAMSMLTPAKQYNDALNLDTVFTVVVNDGHGGINSIEVPVMINIEPVILSTDLLPAQEDVDYNPELRDEEKMIEIFDPNFHQDHYFQLAYDDDALGEAGLGDLELPDTIMRDPCFPEAGYHFLRNYDDDGVMILDLKTTPLWLKINKESGLLYGTPGVKDAPKTEELGNLETVTVLVWDEDSLAAIKIYSLRVDYANHQPGITAAPEVRCVDKDMPYEDVIFIYDKDLKRGRVDGDETEELTITVLQPTGLKIEYLDEDGTTWTESNMVTGIRSKDTVQIRISTDSFNAQPEVDGRVTIKIMVEDKDGLTDTLIYRLKYSLETDFICDLAIKNAKGAENILQFGTGPLATSGYAIDGEELGHLDSNYCEYELPPLPHQDIFDVRWEIPTSGGVYRNIFLTGSGSADKPGEKRIYRGLMQSGGEAGHTSNHYPLTITWDATEVPAIDDQERNASAGSWIIRDAYSSGNIFKFNMNTGEGLSTSDVAFERMGDEITLTIFSTAIDRFQILYNWNPDPVDEPIAGLTTQIAKVTPNPFSSITNIQYSLQYREHVRLEIVDQLGKVVKVLVDKFTAPGNYSVQWDGSDNVGNECSSGSYNCRMVAGSAVVTHPIVIVK